MESPSFNDKRRKISQNFQKTKMSLEKGKVNKQTNKNKKVKEILERDFNSSNSTNTLAHYLQKKTFQF